MLGVEPGFSVRAVSVPNYWAISPAWNCHFNASSQSSLGKPAPIGTLGAHSQHPAQFNAKQGWSTFTCSGSHRITLSCTMTNLTACPCQHGMLKFESQFKEFLAFLFEENRQILVPYPWLPLCVQLRAAYLQRQEIQHLPCCHKTSIANCVLTEHMHTRMHAQWLPFAGYKSFFTTLWWLDSVLIQALGSPQQTLRLSSSGFLCFHYL